MHKQPKTCMLNLMQIKKEVVESDASEEAPKKLNGSIYSENKQPCVIIYLIIQRHENKRHTNCEYQYKLASVGALL